MRRVPTITLTGLNGANPLGFLAALGTLRTARFFNPTVRLRWDRFNSAWRPTLVDTISDLDTFLSALEKALSTLSVEPFKFEKRLPFDAGRYLTYVRGAQNSASLQDRRLADFAAAFGSEVLIDEKGNFEDTQLRMVRSGDSKGQGFLYYALRICDTTTKEDLRRSLIQPWDYSDDSFSFRWDPVEDQRYAIRWDDPSKNKHGTMRGANRMAIEAMPLLPTMPKLRGLATTTFSTNSERQTWLAWPIWKEPLSEDVIRSLLALKEIHVEKIDRMTLAVRGIVEVFRSVRFAPNQYYKNFSPAQPA